MGGVVTVEEVDIVRCEIAQGLEAEEELDGLLIHEEWVLIGRRVVIYDAAFDGLEVEIQHVVGGATDDEAGEVLSEVGVVSES